MARIIPAVLAIGVLAWAGYAATLHGLADWRAMRWRYDIGQWIDKGTTPSAERWVQTADGLHAALKLTPRDPSLHDYLGVLNRIGAWAFRTADEPSRIYAAFALLHFRQAVSMRPTSAYSWAGLAESKYSVGEVDEELFGAMALATEYGPWDPRVQLIVADLGLALWDAMDAKQKSLAVANLNRTAQRQAGELTKRAERRKRIAVLCGNAIENIDKFTKC